MNATPTALAEVLVIHTRAFGDDRGYFKEMWQASRYREAGIDGPFVQDNLSVSKKGVLRGLHLQVAPSPQGKLVSVLKGAVLDIAVDVRVGSPTFGQWVTEQLSEENGHQLWVPYGFAHGFLALEDETIVTYKCTAPYDHGAEIGISWQDPAFNLALPEMAYHLSGKDADAPNHDAFMSRLPRFNA
jgi:dTDP-4-dehydrorhamnose 3,5-epimerase